jgi:glycerol-3-phosphate acyltransferase PlsX
MLIAVDAVGGDHYPGNPVQGAVLALEKDPEISVLLVGPEQMIRNELQSLNYEQRRLHILHAPEIIGMEDSPATAVRSKQMSSIVVGIGALKQKKCDAFVSAGNTGALLAASTFILGKLEGVSRPTIAAYYPTIDGFKLLVDAGANLDLKPETLVQFADMASIFCSEILGIENPRIGLLNVGSEEEKGTDLLKATHKLLKERDNFVGNLEGKDILFAKADVYLTDGLTGNVALKLGESFPDALKAMIMNGVKSGAINRDDAQTAQHVLSTALDAFNYEHVGGIPFLGVDGVSIVGHGGSSATAICNMILGAKKCVTTAINQKIIDSLN